MGALPFTRKIGAFQMNAGEPCGLLSWGITASSLKHCQHPIQRCRDRAEQHGGCSTIGMMRQDGPECILPCLHGITPDGAMAMEVDKSRGEVIPPAVDTVRFPVITLPRLRFRNLPVNAQKGVLPGHLTGRKDQLCILKEESHFGHFRFIDPSGVEPRSLVRGIGKQKTRPAHSRGAGLEKRSFPSLAGVQLNDELLVDHGVDLFAGGNADHLAGEGFLVD